MPVTCVKEAEPATVGRFTIQVSKGSSRQGGPCRIKGFDSSQHGNKSLGAWGAVLTQIYRSPQQCLCLGTSTSGVPP